MHAPQPFALFGYVLAAASGCVPFAAVAGHAVRITWYRESGAEPRPFLPQIEDLDTRVTFTSDWLYETPAAASAKSVRVWIE
jgi:hypothetical protein